MLLLHLSDIHFRKGEIGTAQDSNASLRNELVRDAAAQCQKIGAAPDAILVSGDIAYSGDLAEYTFALQWLEILCEKCGTTLSAVFVIPGNHDVVRKISSRHLIQSIHRDIKNTSDVSLEGMIRGLLSDDETSRLLYEALGPYNDFAGQFFCGLLPPQRTIATRDLLLNDGSILRLSGFNSAFVSSGADKAGDLFLDPACFQLLREDGVEHLVMCHHPYAWLRQGDALKDFLSNMARVHLFGHEHTNRVVLSRDWIQIAASAAQPDKTESGWEPGYNLIELSVQGSGSNRLLDLKAHIRVWQQRPNEFRGKTDRGADVFAQSIKLDAWTPPPVAEVAQAVERGLMTAEIGKPAAPVESGGSDPMDSMRDISIRFFKLTLSQKSAIAGKLNLLEEEDASQPDFERFRRVFVRARDRGLVTKLDNEIKEATALKR